MARRTGSSGERTARDIRAAALKLFAEHGFAAVSMRQIAQAVGVQAGALYLYTDDKQSLLADLMLEHLEELLAAWARVPPRRDDPHAWLLAFVRFHIRHHLPRADAVFVAYMELRSLSPANFARVEALRRRYEQALEDILRAGAARGVFRLEDPRIASLGLIAMLTGVTAWYRDGGRLPVARIEEIYGHMVLRAVGAEWVAGPDLAAAR